MVGVGIALYQLTSLELGPGARDFRVNLDLNTPLVQEMAQPLEVGNGVVGEISVVLHSESFVTRFQTRAQASAVAATGAASTAASVGALPIIGRCQSPSTGSSSVTQPSKGWGAGHKGKRCSEEGGRD